MLIAAVKAPASSKLEYIIWGITYCPLKMLSTAPPSRAQCRGPSSPRQIVPPPTIAPRCLLPIMGLGVIFVFGVLRSSQSIVVLLCVSLGGASEQPAVCCLIQPNTCPWTYCQTPTTTTKALFNLAAGHCVGLYRPCREAHLTIC